MVKPYIALSRNQNCLNYNNNFFVAKLDFLFVEQKTELSKIEREDVYPWHSKDLKRSNCLFSNQKPGINQRAYACMQTSRTSDKTMDLKPRFLTQIIIFTNVGN